MCRSAAPYGVLDRRLDESTLAGPSFYVADVTGQVDDYEAVRVAGPGLTGFEQAELFGVDRATATAAGIVRTSSAVSSTRRQMVRVPGGQPAGAKSHSATPAFMPMAFCQASSATFRSARHTARLRLMATTTSAPVASAAQTTLASKNPESPRAIGRKEPHGQGKNRAYHEPGGLRAGSGLPEPSSVANTMFAPAHTAERGR